MTFVLKATFEQTYMFYPGANFAKCFSFIFSFDKKQKQKKQKQKKQKQKQKKQKKKKKRKETLTKLCALTKLPCSCNTCNQFPF